MPRKAKRYNEQLRARFTRLPSPSPGRTGQHMTQAELADAINAELAKLYPDRDLAREELLVDWRWVGDLIRGKNRWPGDERRQAVLRVLGADTPDELGLYLTRPTGALGGGGQPTHSAPVPAPGRHLSPMPAQAAASGEAPADGAGTAARPAAPSGLLSTAAVAPASGASVSGAAVGRRGFDTTTAHPARRYNYWLGGKSHFPADRESGELIARAWPAVVTAARENRAFLRRSVTCLADLGIRQFLDVGCGLPLPGQDTHDLVQRVAADARVVYVDNDPMVSSHAEALLCDDPQGRTGYVEADIRDPTALVRHPRLRSVLDLDRPVGLLVVAVLHFIHDQDEAISIFRQLSQALPSGSYVAFSHATMDFSSPADRARYEQMFDAGQTDVRARTEDQLADFFTGLQLIEPGLVAAPHWRPDRPSAELPAPDQVAIYGGVGWIP